MALLIQTDEFGEAWQELVEALRSTGSLTSPRGMTTKEILNVTLCVRHGLMNVLTSSVRDLNYRFLIAEWLWIQAGLNEVDLLAKYNSQMRNFSDDDIILSGAYGPRLMPQIPYIIESLSKPDSRQAVATIWTPSPSSSKDIPCTISLQWLIRGGFVHCTATMRSSDVWLGLPYDFFTFGQLTNYIAMITGKLVGSVTMNLASSHLYREHFKAAEEVRNTGTIMSPLIPREVPPNSSELTQILKGNRDWSEFPARISFWHYYANALTKNKAFALEVLHAIEPSF
jgi:thymidylate synthase